MPKIAKEIGWVLSGIGVVITAVGYFVSSGYWGTFLLLPGIIMILRGFIPDLFSSTARKVMVALVVSTFGMALLVIHHVSRTERPIALRPRSRTGSSTSQAKIGSTASLFRARSVKRISWPQVPPQKGAMPAPQPNADACPPNYIMLPGARNTTIDHNVAPPCVPVLVNGGTNTTFTNNLIIGSRPAALGQIVIVKARVLDSNAQVGGEYVSTVLIEVNGQVPFMRVAVHSEALTNVDFLPWANASAGGMAAPDPVRGPNGTLYSALSNLHGQYAVRIHKSSPSFFYLAVGCGGGVDCQVMNGEGLYDVGRI